MYAEYATIQQLKAHSWDSRLAPRLLLLTPMLIDAAFNAIASHINFNVPKLMDGVKRLINARVGDGST
jgi:hypothetical protein